MPQDIFPLHTPFKPDSSLITWFIVDFLILVLVIFGIFIAPVVIFSDLPFSATATILVIVLVVAILYIAWVRLYYQSMWYELYEDEMRWKRGVIFRSTGIVPYNRITNIDIRQGPIMRMLRISTVSIQTAGYSGKAAPEIRIEAIREADVLRELIRTMVRRASGSGDATGTGTVSPGVPRNADQEILAELIKIRDLLERQTK